MVNESYFLGFLVIQSTKLDSNLATLKSSSQFPGIDLDSQRCLVHFKGRGPVEVPVRHLCAVETSQPEEANIGKSLEMILGLSLVACYRLNMI